jgi:hypothetical protein
VLGTLADVGAVLFVCLAAACAARLAAAADGWSKGLTVGLVPAVVFAVLFGGYACVGSEPRWRAFSLDLAARPAAAVQQFQLPSPVPRRGIARSQFLVDLETDAEAPPLTVRLNGRKLARGEYRWSRWNAPAGKHLVPYEAYSQFQDRTVSSWPQWWALDVNPAVLAGEKKVTLALAYDRPQRTEASFARLGGVVTGREGSAVYGPSIRSGPSNSLYRWIVAGDWRLWESTEVAGTGGQSRVEQVKPGVPSSARFNIRLVVHSKKGRPVVY